MHYFSNHNTIIGLHVNLQTETLRISSGYECDNYKPI